MPLRRWKRISTEWISENPWWRYRKDVFEVEPGRRGEYHCVHTAGSVMVVPVTRDGRFLLVEQYRYLMDRFSFEFPAGAIDEGEAPHDAALRELGEEAGVSGVLTPLGAYNPWNGVTDETCHVFLATELLPLAQALDADETESFERHELTRDELTARIVDGTLWDGMTLAVWAMYCAHKG